MRVNIYKPPYGDCSNNGASSKSDAVFIINFGDKELPRTAWPADVPAVRLVKRKHGNVVCVPVGLEDKWTMFGGCFVHTSDGRFHDAVSKLSGYDFGFPVALHDRVEE